MKITIRFFAMIREAVGCEYETLEFPESVKTIDDVRKRLVLRGDAWEQALGNASEIRFALNHKTVEPNAEICNHCEIAFFPPVTGG